MTADGSATQLSCPRDRIPTRLTCSTCATPICPKCFVRTEVGLRCPKCAVGEMPPRRRRRPAWLALPAVALVAVAAVMALGTRQSPETSSPTTAASDPVLDADATQRTVERRDLGFALELPPNWIEAPDEPGSASVYFARAPSNQSWVRVFRRDTSQGVPEMLDQLTEGLRKQGGVNPARQLTRVGNIPAYRLDVQVPTPFGPLAVMSSQTYLLVKRDVTVYTLAISTIDPATQGAALARLGTTFRLL